MAAIHLENVSKTFEAGPTQKWLDKRSGRGTTGRSDTDASDRGVARTIRALDGVDLFIPDGTTTVVVGPSGSGKSTLLRAVAGLTDYGGLVAYDNHDMEAVPPGERRIGMVFQNYALYPHFRGRDNLKFFFRVHDAPDEEAEERIRVTAELMGVGFRDLLKRKPGTLSGGQQQRLAIARAIVRQPDLFLFDEPLSNLDAKLRTRTRTEIKRLLHRFNITALYVTHDQTEAMALGDQIAVMRAGRIEQVGPFREILVHPRNLFVAGFLGMPPMNLIQATVVDRELVIDSAHHFPVPQSLSPNVSNGQTITVGIRPEAVHVWQAGDPPAAESWVFTGTIDMVEPDFGTQQQVAYITTGGVTCAVVAPLEIRLVQGYDTRVVLPAASLLFFDTANETRISR